MPYIVGRRVSFDSLSNMPSEIAIFTVESPASTEAGLLYAWWGHQALLYLGLLLVRKAKKTGNFSMGCVALHDTMTVKYNATLYQRTGNSFTKVQNA